MKKCTECGCYTDLLIDQENKTQCKNCHRFEYTLNKFLSLSEEIARARDWVDTLLNKEKENK